MYLLTSDVKTRKLIDANREIMEKALNNLNVAAEVVARRSNAMWDIFLQTQEAAKSLTGNIIITKSVRLQTKSMRRRKTRATRHGIPLFIGDDHLDFFLPVWKSSRGIGGKEENRHYLWWQRNHSGYKKLC